MNLLDIIDSYREDEERIAHLYRESSMTYRELAEKSDAVAQYLIEKFEEYKGPIVVYGHKQHEMLICFLACVKAGHPYIPIDSSLPIERIKDIIESSNTRIIFSIENLKIEFKNIEILTIESIKIVFQGYRGKKPELKYRVKSEDIYYIIYTSGSTGKPKGVQITLSCLESFVKWGMQIANIHKYKNYVFMNQAPFSFDLSVMDLYLSLASGSILFSIDKFMTANLQELFKYLRKSNIKIWVSTPSFADMCLADSSFNSELLPELKIILFCGETLTNSCVEKLHSRFKNVKVINLYGPTEATVSVTAVEITEEMCKKIKPLPVGYVKDDCKILIMNKSGEEVKEGKKGEIVIAGDSVSTGYFNNVENTKKAFSTILINNEKKRCYSTGDEGYIKNGMLYYCGRIDFQVKLNGYRIELEDIENNLRKLEFINNAVVLPFIKQGKIQYLAGVVALKGELHEKEFKITLMIKNELKKFLPDYMIPRKIVIRESLPMTVNGKVNRKSLMEDIS